MKLILHALFLTVLILLVNMNLRTQLAEDEAMWQNRLELHQGNPPFSLRPFTSAVTGFLSEQYGLSLRDAFVVGQYPLVFALLWSFALFLKRLMFSIRQQLYGMWALALSFPILCVHFIPNFSYDDLWAYIGLVWMAYCLVAGRLFLASACLLFAALSRESVLIVFPAFFVFRGREISLRTCLLAAVLPVALYLAYRLMLYPEIRSGRFTRLPVNFADAGETRQTLHSLFVSFGWLWFAAGAAIRNYLKSGIRQINRHVRSLSVSALIVGLSCVTLTLAAALARETRLFYTPFVFLIPLAVFHLENIRPAMDRVKNRGRLWLVWLLAIMILAASVLLSILIFPSFRYLPMLDFHRVYFAFNLALAVMVLTMTNGRLSRYVAGQR
jgi:hypothetical protein